MNQEINHKLIMNQEKHKLIMNQGVTTFLDSLISFLDLLEPVFLHFKIMISLISWFMISLWLIS